MDKKSTGKKPSTRDDAAILREVRRRLAERRAERADPRACPWLVVPSPEVRAFATRWVPLLKSCESPEPRFLSAEEMAEAEESEEEDFRPRAPGAFVHVETLRQVERLRAAWLKSEGELVPWQRALVQIFKQISEAVAEQGIAHCPACWAAFGHQAGDPNLECPRCDRDGRPATRPARLKDDEFPWVTIGKRARVWDVGGLLMRLVELVGPAALPPEYVATHFQSALEALRKLKLAPLGVRPGGRGGYVSAHTAAFEFALALGFDFPERERDVGRRRAKARGAR